MTDQEFRIIPGHEKYEINNCGIVRNKHTKHELEYVEGKYGHRQVMFTYRDDPVCQYQVISVHRTVFRLFSDEGNDIEGNLVEHRDQEPRNNHISNLRLSTPTQNMYNRRKKSNSKSNFKGVHYDKTRKKWQATIQL